jgi:hypothetical protein
VNRFLWLHSLLPRLGAWLRPPRFAKYRPAPRLGARRVERRVLRRIQWHLADSRH